MEPQGLVRRIPGHTLHLVQRGRNRAACFFREQDRRFYLGWLAEYAGLSGCAVHAYALMGNHVHLLLTPSRGDGIAVLLRDLGSRYGNYIAEAYEHTAPIWDEREKLRPVYPRRYLLACMRYIELNPVRAGLVARPDDYRWSSYGSNALGLADALVRPHAFYYALGRMPAERQAAYRGLFQANLLTRTSATYRF